MTTVVNTFRRAAAALALAAGTAAAVVVPAAAHAQLMDPYGTRQRTGPPRFFGGGELIYASPQGDFRDYVNEGYGAAGHFILGADRTGIFGLRFDVGFLNYGNERQRDCISTTISCRVTLDVTTSNNIFMLGVGPQLMLPNGTLRPYVNGSVGLSYFWTESSLSGSDNSTTFASTRNFSDAVFASSAGAGVYIPVHRGRQPISLDLGARYHWNGRTRYLRKGSIVDNPDGTISINPIESRTDLVTYHLGVSFGTP
jgi:hypothetical protein